MHGERAQERVLQKREGQHREVRMMMQPLKKRLALTLPLYTILQILSVTLFEKVSLPQLLTSFTPGNSDPESAHQLPLFEL